MTPEEGFKMRRWKNFSGTIKPSGPDDPGG
jgi:hypothetical protein